MTSGLGSLLPLRETQVEFPLPLAQPSSAGACIQGVIQLISVSLLFKRGLGSVSWAIPQLPAPLSHDRKGRLECAGSDRGAHKSKDEKEADRTGPHVGVRALKVSPCPATRVGNSRPETTFPGLLCSGAGSESGSQPGTTGESAEVLRATSGKAGLGGRCAVSPSSDGKCVRDLKEAAKAPGGEGVGPTGLLAGDAL